MKQNCLELKCGGNKVNKPENKFNVNLFHKNIKEINNFVLMLDFPETLNWIVCICNNKQMWKSKIVRYVLKLKVP